MNAINHVDFKRPSRQWVSIAENQHILDLLLQDRPVLTYRQIEEQSGRSTETVRGVAVRAGLHERRSYLIDAVPRRTAELRQRTEPELNTKIGRILARLHDLTPYTPQQIKSRKRTIDVSRARQAVMLAARKCGGLSTAQIGRALGNRDGSTTRHLIDVARYIYDHNPDFAQLVDRLVEAGGA
ncbi:helix-turn-helix domain-containing protein [Blastomonas sp. CCH9-A1]|uniref:helix-turn-helix domain-containing protein n=1 Tax=Blastomonas sp. CCH9-A1 TaxID=1768738 RepID=UPI000824CFDB|nr:helix-turn-helix domain-containing protein [Blastomonas sp. CCH9-A1]